MGSYSLQEIIHSGGITLYFLIVCSILLLTVIIERSIFFTNNRLHLKKFIQEIMEHLKNGKYENAMEMCRKNKSVIAKIALNILEKRDLSKEKIEAASEIDITETMMYFEKRIPVMGTLAVIAPFIGLSGTVLGIMQAFADIAAQGNAGQSIVAKGVSEALIATAAGLFVAIPASIFFNYFKSRCHTIKTQTIIMAGKIIEFINGESK